MMKSARQRLCSLASPALRSTQQDGGTAVVWLKDEQCCMLPLRQAVEGNRSLAYDLAKSLSLQAVTPATAAVFATDCRECNSAQCRSRLPLRCLYLRCCLRVHTVPINVARYVKASQALIDLHRL